MYIDLQKLFIFVSAVLHMLSTEYRTHDVHVLFGDVSYEVRSAHWCINNKVKRKFTLFSEYHKFSFHVMKTFKFSLMLCIRENTDVFITLAENIYGIHSERVNIPAILKYE